MTHCPNCQAKIPFKKYLWLHNYSKVRCSHCKVRLVPDRKVLSLIGGIGGLTAAVTVWLMAVLCRYADGGYTVEFIVSAFSLVALQYLALVLITRNVVDFRVKDDAGKPHKEKNTEEY